LRFAPARPVSAAPVADRLPVLGVASKQRRHTLGRRHRARALGRRAPTARVFASVLPDLETAGRPGPGKDWNGLLGSPKSVASGTRSWTNRPICGAAMTAFIRRLSSARRAIAPRMMVFVLDPGLNVVVGPTGSAKVVTSVQQCRGWHGFGAGERDPGTQSLKQRNCPPR
jgi:hypothetical protein